jgi:hypothetical protein
MTSSLSFRRRAFAIGQMALSGLIVVGSCFEVVNLLVPSLIPSIQEEPLMKLHHHNRVVFFWTLLSNLLNFVLGSLLVRGALGTLRGDVAASRLGRRVLYLGHGFILRRAQ